MEKKKLLLIAVSLGVFLVIVVGLSILIFAPRKRETVTAGTSTARVDPFDNSRLRNDPVTIETLDEDSDTAPSTASNLYVYDGNQSTPDTAPDTTITVIEIAPPSKTAVPDTAPGGRAAQSSTTASSASTPAATVYRSPSAPRTASPTTSSKDAPASATPSVPARSTSVAATTPARATSTVAPAPSTPARTTNAAVTTSSAPARVTSAVATAQPVSAVRPSQKSYNNYWVQAGSFSTQIRAEDVKETLHTKGLTSVIETSAVNGKSLFRVRIGPYTSQNEADYWLAIVKSIDGFQDSLVWQN